MTHREQLRATIREAIDGWRVSYDGPDLEGELLQDAIADALIAAGLVGQPTAARADEPRIGDMRVDWITGDITHVYDGVRWVPYTKPTPRIPEGMTAEKLRDLAGALNDDTGNFWDHIPNELCAWADALEGVPPQPGAPLAVLPITRIPLTIVSTMDGATTGGVLVGVLAADLDALEGAGVLPVDETGGEM